MARVGDGDRGRLELGAVYVGHRHTGQQSYTGRIFCVAVVQARGLQDRRIVDRRDGQREGAGLAVEAGVLGVHHRVADLDRLVAVELGAEPERNIASDEVDQCAVGAQHDRVATGVGHGAASDRQDADLCRHAVAIGQKRGDWQLEGAGGVLCDLQTVGQRGEVLVTAGFWGLAAAHIDFDDRLTHQRGTIFVIGQDIDGGRTSCCALEFQSLKGGVDIGHAAADLKAIVDAAHVNLGTCGRNQIE